MIIKISSFVTMPGTLNHVWVHRLYMFPLLSIITFLEAENKFILYRCYTLSCQVVCKINMSHSITSSQVQSLCLWTLMLVVLSLPIFPKIWFKTCTPIVLQPSSLMISYFIQWAILMDLSRLLADCIYIHEINLYPLDYYFSYNILCEFNNYTHVLYKFNYSKMVKYDWMSIYTISV